MRSPKKRVERTPSLTAPQVAKVLTAKYPQLRTIEFEESVRQGYLTLGAGHATQKAKDL